MTPLSAADLDEIELEIARHYKPESSMHRLISALRESMKRCEELEKLRGCLRDEGCCWGENHALRAKLAAAEKCVTICKELVEEARPHIDFQKLWDARRRAIDILQAFDSLNGGTTK